jgi:hypothetical protein
MEVINMLVIVDVIIGKNGISTEVFSDIRNARKFRDKLMQKYGNEYTICEMAKNINERLDDSILNRY